MLQGFVGMVVAVDQMSSSKPVLLLSGEQGLQGTGKDYRRQVQICIAVLMKVESMG